MKKPLKNAGATRASYEPEQQRATGRSNQLRLDMLHSSGISHPLILDYHAQHVRSPWTYTTTN